MVSQIKHFIGGKLVAGGGGRTAPVFNPATGEQTGEVGLAAAQVVGSAIRIGITCGRADAVEVHHRSTRALAAARGVLESELASL